ncbi:MAG TPA: RNA polymerase sigma factor [Polyangiaceae bacterium]|jgi:RNA polymerase sigma-70 factor (ECF subfamily)|nr:RNA polymerase sigma factor [Polyangiaceae bacterium]
MSPERKRVQLRAVRSSGVAPRLNPAPPSSEAELLAGIIRGDERISVELYHRLLPAIEAGLIRVLGRRESDHEDLVQIAFEQLILTLSRQSYGQACSLKTWASSIAAHVALKALRTRYRQRRVFNSAVAVHDLTERQSGTENLESTLESRQSLERVRAELAQLAPAKAEAVLLHDVLGHGLAEVAALMGSSVAAAQTRLSRGRRELLERLRQADGGEVTQ